MNHGAMSGPDPSWTPRSGVADATAAIGEPAVVAWCCDLLTGRAAPEDPAGPPLEWIGGRPGTFPLERWLRPDQRYWPRVWAARALRYAWRPEAEPAVVAALADEAWRVREHACAVVQLRELSAGDEILGLTADPVARVRVAACEALAQVGEAEHADALRGAADDDEPAVAEAAEAALAVLAHRLDRPL